MIDLFSIQPIDGETLVASARAAGNQVITVEDHYAHGGLGDWVQSVLAPEGIPVYRLPLLRFPTAARLRN